MDATETRLFRMGLLVLGLFALLLVLIGVGIGAALL